VSVAYFCGEVLVEVEFVALDVVPVAFFFTFFLWTFLVLVVAVSWLAVEVFWALLAAVGAAIRKGTATALRRADVNSFFIC
jgi:hypothetical protein